MNDDDAAYGIHFGKTSVGGSEPSSSLPLPPPPSQPSPPSPHFYQLCSDPVPADKWHVGADIWPDNTLHVMEAEVLAGAVQALVVIEGMLRVLTIVIITRQICTTFPHFFFTTFSPLF